MTAQLRYYFIIIISASAENVRARSPFHIHIYSRFLPAWRIHLGSLLFTTLINKALEIRNEVREREDAFAQCMSLEEVYLIAPPAKDAPWENLEANY